MRDIQAKLGHVVVNDAANKPIAPLHVDEVVRVTSKCVVPPFGHKQYTAFTLGSMGLYECESMPSGLCNAPPAFQRLMQNCLGELNLTYCLIYLDDMIVFSDTPEEHLRRMCVVFDRLRSMASN